jgi:hypothetical protein
LIICSATPSPAGDYCQVVALRYGVSREVCRAELVEHSHRLPRSRLECVEDPALVAFLTEQADEDPLEIGVLNDASRARIRSKGAKIRHAPGAG